MQYVIGVDLGGTQVRAIRCDTAGKIIAHAHTRTAANAGAIAILAQIEELIAEVRGDLPRQEIIGVGVGSPGPVDGRRGFIFEAPNLPGWVNVPLKTLLAERTGLPVEVGNDANAAALGEWHFGSGRGTDHFVYVTISTGIGGGVIVDRALLLGRKGIAGEVGHMVMQAGGPRCGCGNLGCWEAVASGTALARIANQALVAGERSSLRSKQDGHKVTAKDVAMAALSGDALALRLMEQEGDLIGAGVVSLLHLFSPECIALGGGVMKSADLLMPRIRRSVVDGAMGPYADARIELATLGDRTGVLGAAALILVPHASGQHLHA